MFAPPGPGGAGGSVGVGGTGHGGEPGPGGGGSGNSGGSGGGSGNSGGSGGSGGGVGGGGGGQGGAGGAGCCNPPPLTPDWATTFEDTSGYGFHYAKVVAVDSNDNIIVAGDSAYGIDLGGGPLSPHGQYDVFIGKFTPDGDHLWSKLFGGADNEGVGDIAVDADDNVYLTGHFRDSADFGGGALPSAGQSDVFVVKMDSAGAHLWSRRFGDFGYDSGRAVAARGTELILAGGFTNSISFDGNALQSAGQTDIFVTRLATTDGSHLSSTSYGDSQADSITSLALSSNGDTVLHGYFGGSIDFGAGSMTSWGGYDLYLASFGPAGALSWAQRFGDDFSERSERAAIDDAGNVFICGRFEGTITFGGSTFTATGSDGYIAKLDPGGAHQWSRSADASIKDLATDASGRLHITGGASALSDLGGGPLPNAGDADALYASYLATGAHHASLTFGGPADDAGSSIALDSTGHAVLVGTFRDIIDLGSGPIVGNPNYSHAWIMRFLPP